MTTRVLWRPLLALLCTMSHFSVASNVDSLAPEREVTFSHVYNIDVPGGSGCKVPNQDDTGLQLESTKSGENDIIFRHNIKLQSPKCDCGESETFKSLLYRVNGLEEEVNYLKTQCSQGCCGTAGVDTSCSGHGTYQRDTCSCLCYPGWEAPDCSVSSCPDECNDNGRCVDGRCVCHQGYTGDDCGQLMCPSNCNDKGHCRDGKCVCFPHFTGEDCSIQKCPNDCNANGRCVDGQCVCDAAFYGEDCSLVHSPQGLRLVQQTDVSLRVDWVPVPGAEYYVLSYHPKGQGTALKKFRVPNMESSYLIRGLKSGLTYIVQIQAVIRGIQSEAKNMEATTGVSTVKDIQVLDQTEVSIQVDWKNPQSEVDHFRLTYTDPSGQEEAMSVQRSQEMRTKHTIVGLKPGTEYLIALQAIKGTTKGNPSSVTGFTDMDPPPNLITSQVTEDTATVSWDGVQSQIDGYMLSYTSDAGSSAEIPVGRDMTSYRLVGLKPGVVYTVYIWAYRKDKISRKSSTQAETELDAPANLLVQEKTETSFKVSWDQVQAEIDGYVLTYTSSEGSSGQISLGPDAASYSLTGLRPGVVYTVYVWAVKGSQASRKTSTQAETELDAPANLLAREQTETSFKVSWEHVLAEIDGYVLTHSSSESSSGEIRVGPEVDSHSLTGLRPGVVYTVYVWAVKGARRSRKISVQVETEIDAPKDLQALDVTMDSAMLTWTPPLADIEGYILTFRDEEGNMETVEMQLGSRESTFAMSSVQMGKGYIVSIIAYRGNKRSRMVETIFKAVGIQYPFPMDCLQIMKNGNKRSGVYTVYVNNERSKPIEAYCDMDSYGGGWLVLQRRTSGKLDFMKRWRQYAAGFGNMTDEFWIGLDKIYELTNTPTQYELRFDLGRGSERAYAVYDSFKVAPAKQKFKLSIGNYRGTAGDAMTYHQGRPWTTIDSDNDIALGNCALTHRGAWWYKNCHLANLNGKWGDNRHSLGINWEPWTGHLASLDFTEMKIRPVGAFSSRKRRSLMMAREKTQEEEKEAR
ncbi:tenascin-N [Nerophis lumbriciformis]|uniref:tenascin-N n=1 Tax=Nerophis lumbriciformis TaxID=546530 RepID=UPI003BAA0063